MRVPANAARRARAERPWLKPTLVNAAWAATRKKDRYLRAVPPHQDPTRCQEGDPRSRQLHADRGLLHAPRRRRIP